MEQAHRAVKRLTRAMMGFKSFEAAQCTLAGIERMHMLRKGQLEGNEFAGLTATEQFYALALYSLHLARFIHLKMSSTLICDTTRETHTDEPGSLPAAL
jgi:DDE superfamily endonuclease